MRRDFCEDVYKKSQNKYNKEEEGGINMKRVKLQMIATFLFIVLSLSGCQKERLPVPEYPLNIESLSVILEECDMSHTIVEEEPISVDGIEGQSFALYEKPEDTFAYAGIATREKGEERSLGCTFITLSMDSDITEEEFKQAIVLATRLFGDFKTETQVYDKFMKNFDPEDGLTWETEIDGIYCRIKFTEMKDHAMKYVLNVRFTTDIDTFPIFAN